VISQTIFQPPSPNSNIAWMLNKRDAPQTNPQYLSSVTKKTKVLGF